MTTQGKAAPETALAYLELAAKFLAARGAASARLDAELLLAMVLATDRVGEYSVSVHNEPSPPRTGENALIVRILDAQGFAPRLDYYRRLESDLSARLSKEGLRV